MASTGESKNYITPEGLKRLQEELQELKYKTRPEVTATVAWAASNGDRSENADYIYGKRRLREIDRRIHHLIKRLEKAHVVDPKTVQSDKIRFGAIITLLNEDGDQKVYRIVGIDEADASKGWISWISPLAKAALNKAVGDMIVLTTPKGEQELEVIKIEY